MPRLPIPGSDESKWGDILNEYLRVEHNEDGTQKTLAITKGGTGATTAGDARTNLGAAADSDVVKKDELFINVKDYGAVGDGTTDDTAAIQSAIDAASTTGATVYLPPGIYSVIGLVAAPGNNSNINIVGDGYGTVLKARASGVVITIDGGSSNFQRQRIARLRFDLNGYNATAIRKNNGQHGIIEDVYIGGDASLVTGGCIEISGTMNWLRDVHMRAVGAAYGIKVIDRADGLSVTDCEVIGPAVGFGADGSVAGMGTSWSLTRSRFEQCQTSAIRLPAVVVLNISILACRIENCGSETMLLRGLDSNNRIMGVLIDGNYISGLEAGWVGVTLHRISNVALRGNSFRSKQGLGSYPAGAAFAWTSPCSLVRMEENHTDSTAQTVSASMTGYSAVFAVNDAFTSQTSLDRSSTFGSNIRINGALDHDGTTVGFYGATPVTKPTGVSAAKALSSLGLATGAEQVYDVKDYGAKGDGTTDDTAAVQAAINAAEAAGPGSVVQLSGVHACAGLTVTRDIILQGGHVPGADNANAPTATALLRNGSSPLLSCRGTNRTTDRRGRVQLRNLMIRDGTNLSTQSLLDCKYADSVVLEDVTFWQPDNQTTCGHMISAEECWDWRLRNVVFKHYGDTGKTKSAVYLFNGASANCNDWQFLGCRWQEGVGTAVNFDSSGGATRNAFFWFIQCKFEDTQKTSGTHVDGAASKVYFSQCQFAGCGARQVNVGSDSPSWKFSQCLFANVADIATEMVLLAGAEASISQCHFQSPGTSTAQYVNVTGNENEVGPGNSRSDSTALVNTSPPATTKVHHNPDFLTEYSSTAQITSGNTSITITHGLHYTPAQHHIMVTPHSSLGTASTFWVSGITATQFVINLNANPTATVTFAWQIQRTRG